MKTIKILLLAATLLATAAQSAFAQDKEYKASLFGIKSNGVIDNTESIQKAIDFISSKGGGVLVFSVGRYVTGAVDLKDNVKIKLGGGSVVVGSSNIFDYCGKKAIFNAEGVKNTGIYGIGVLDGNQAELRADYERVKAAGLLPAGTPLPALFYFGACEGVSLKSFIMRNTACPGTLYIVEGCNPVIDGIYSDTPLVTE